MENFSSNYLDNTLEKMKPSQKRAFKAMIRGENIFLTGGAGTGKSYVIRAFIRYCKQAGINVLAAAHTGLAAQNIGGVTLVKAFGLPPTGPIRRDKTRARASTIVQNADVVIIDEISMCRIDAFELIIRKLNSVNKSREKKRAEIEAGTCLNVGQPLKPVQVILVGDFFQLPPVLKDDERKVLEETQYHSKIGYAFAFQSSKWHSYGGTGFRTYKLKDVVRQSDPEFISNLNKARVGDSSCIEYFNEHARRFPIPNAIWLFSSNEKANNMNNAYLKKIDAPSFTYKAETMGYIKKTEMPVEPVITLKKGARVIFMKNGPNYANGQFGTVVFLNQSRVTVRLDATGKNVTVGKEKWDLSEYVIKETKDEDGYTRKSFDKISIGYFSQIPLRLGYAITIHKSQGQTYTAVNLDPHSFTSGMLYVALSRVKSIDGLYLDNDVTVDDLQVSIEATRFYNRPCDYCFFGRGQHGGARKGAGRKKGDYTTKTMRIPVELENQFRQLIDDWKTSEMEKKIDEGTPFKH